MKRRGFLALLASGAARGQMAQNPSPMVEHSREHPRLNETTPAGERFPIVGLSREPDTDPDRMTRLGVDRFITKPFSLSLLRSIVRELLDNYKPVTA